MELKPSGVVAPGAGMELGGVLQRYLPPASACYLVFRPETLIGPLPHCFRAWSIGHKWGTTNEWRDQRGMDAAFWASRAHSGIAVRTASAKLSTVVATLRIASCRSLALSPLRCRGSSPST